MATGALPPPPPQEAIIDPRLRATMSAMVKESQAGRDVSWVFIVLFRIFDRQVHSFSTGARTRAFPSPSFVGFGFVVGTKCSTDVQFFQSGD